MKKIASFLVLLGVIAFAQAQKTIIVEEKIIDTNPKVVEKYPIPSNQKTITIRLNGNKVNADKMIVEIDGKNITVNGKNIGELKDVDVNINENKFLFKNDEFKVDLGKRPVQGRMPQIKIIGSNGVNKAILGITMQKVDEGVKINEVNPESGAANAGLKEEDIITAINGKKITTEMDITRIVNDSKPGDVLSIDYTTNGKKKNTKAILGQRSNNDMAWSGTFNGEMPFEMPPMPELNMEQFKNMDFDFKGNVNGMPLFGKGNNKPKLGVTLIETEDDRGLEVKEIDENSAAAKAGLQKGDIITTIDDSKVTNIGQIQQAVRNAAQKPLSITYLRNGKEQKTSLKFPKKLKEIDL